MSELHVEPLGAEPAFEGYVRHRVRLCASDREHLLWWHAPSDVQPIDDSWLVGPSLHFGMLRGDDVHLHGRVSPRLMEHLDELQTCVRGREPGYHQVRLSADEVATTDAPHARATLAAFSLGVDTWYTAVRRQPDVDALFYFHGLEARQADDLHLFRVLPGLVASARELGLPLRLVETNMLDVWYEYEPTAATVSIPAVTSAAQLLGSRYGTLLQSGTHATVHSHAVPCPLHRYLACFDTEVFQTELYGELTRIEKLRVLKDVPGAMERLRVCWYARGVYNCGTCPKCIRTIINLDLAGGRGRCATLPATTDLDRASAMRYDDTRTGGYDDYIRENLDEATRQGRHDLIGPLQTWLDMSAPTPPFWSGPLRRLGSARRRWGRSWDKRTAKQGLARHRRKYPGRHLFETLGPPTGG